MKKVLLLALASSILLAGCNGAKSKVIPSDPQKWDQMANDAKSLSEEDRKALTSYLMRMGMASAFSGGKGGIPPGTTIGEAISQQREWEAKQQADEAQAAALKAKVAAQKAADAARINQSATVAVTGVNILPQNAMAGRYSDSLNLEIAIQNKSQKAISGIRGTLDFRDQFGAEISQTSLSLDDTVNPGQTRTLTGYGRDLNQFDDSDKKLSSIPFDKMRVTFTPEMVVFTDGTKIGSLESVDQRGK